MPYDEQKASSPSKPTMNPASAQNGELEEDVNDVPLYRKKRIFIPVLIFLAVAVAAAWYWYANIRGFVSTDDAYIDANRVSISAKVLGRIVHLTVDEGDTVTTGQLLVQLDPADLQAQEVQAKAMLASAEESVHPARIALDRAQDDVQRADAEFQGGAMTKEQHDHFEKTLAAARAEYAVALSRVSTARAELGVVETQLQNMTIRSPIDGTVAKRWVLQGDVVQAGQPIFTVYDTRNTWITANFEETKLGGIHLGDAVEITVDAVPDTTFHGKVFQLGTYAASEFSLIPPNNASGNFTKVTQRVPVKISIPRTSVARTNDVPLVPGMSVEVKIKEY